MSLNIKSSDINLKLYIKPPLFLISYVPNNVYTRGFVNALIGQKQLHDITLRNCKCTKKIDEKNLARKKYDKSLHYILESKLLKKNK